MTTLGSFLCGSLHIEAYLVSHQDRSQGKEHTCKMEITTFCDIKRQRTILALIYC